jgi:hypothetical protein
MKRIEVLTNVPPAKLDQVWADFKDSGAEVTASKQPDGNYRVEAAFSLPEGSNAASTSSVPISGSFFKKSM